MSTLAATTTEERCILWPFVLFFCSDPVYKVVAFAFGALGEGFVTAVASLVIYTPLLLVFASRVRRGELFCGLAFPIVYSFLVFLFLVSLCMHPEYADVMFREGWNYRIFKSVFSPLCGVFVFLFITVARKPRLIMQGFYCAAVLNFAYCFVRLVNATLVGGWDGYNFAGDIIQKTYSLGFGYDVLFSVMVFMIVAFRGERRALHFGLVLAGILFIVVGGNRFPLFVSVLAFFLCALYYGNTILRRNKGVLLVYLAGIVAVVLGSFFFTDLVSALSQLLESVGLSSRSLTALLEGSFTDDNGRSAIQLITDDLIANGSFFGYGMYGDRYYIAPTVFWGYPHNMLYEFQITFGVVPGSALLVMVCLLALHSLFLGKDSELRELTLFFIILCLQLIVSNSYLYSLWFWGLLATIYLQHCAAGGLRMTLARQYSRG